MFSTEKKNKNFVEGKVESGFEPLKELLLRMKEEGRDLGSQLCVYLNGKKVVDLWGGSADVDKEIPYEQDTVQVVFSSSKFVTSLAVAILVDRGLLRYISVCC